MLLVSLTEHYDLLITKLHYIDHKNYTDDMHGSKLYFMATVEYNYLNEVCEDHDEAMMSAER